ncbi:MAG: DUF2971 domain-containing protein [Muribaculaceae bacterium]|nr:DUF2971 domain-containing protein [Muribaculaceae bacterium]
MIEINKDLDVVGCNVTIWRYMPINIFLKLINNRELHFHRIDSYNDKKEGTLTTIDKKIFRYFSNSKEYWERERKRHYVSCWIESPHELALMWHTYGKEGVAIKTSVKSLINSFDHDCDHKIYVSRVHYLDYDKDSSQYNGTPINILKIVFTKRKFYEQEKEIRLLYSYYNSPEGQEEKWYNLNCPIELMIEEIRLAPGITMENEIIIRNLLKRNKIDIPVLKSEI